MSKKLFVVSQIPNLANLLRNEVTKRVTDSKGHLENVDVVDVKLTQKGQERSFLSSLVLVDEDFEQLVNANIVLVDNNLLPALLKAIDTDKYRSSLESIRWIQNTWAGVDSLFKDNIADVVRRHSLTVTRFSGPHFGHSMADYVLGQIISYERSFYYLQTVTKVQKKWRTFDWFDPIIERYRRTDELSALVLGGTGAIGSYVSKKLSSMGMKVNAYGRVERTEEELKQFYEDSGVLQYSTKLEDLLPQVDYIISIMPCTQFTNDLLGNDILSKCSNKRPVLVNVGRGNVISELDIIKALDNGWIRQAILDVFRVEPLPAESPLWSREDVLITPHVSANTRGCDVVNLFVDNYLNYVTGKSLNYVIDFDAGY